MDIIGKLYKDYYCDIKKFDGDSHLLSESDYGGLFNLLNNWRILEKQFKEINFKFFIISDYIDFGLKDININTKILKTKELCPKALIFDFNNQRTSFVIDDHAIKIPFFNKKSDTALIFYGDKLIPSNLPKYKKIIIDTAGNNYSDLISLANYNYPDNSIISISHELLNDELTFLYTNKRNFVILSHSPKKTSIISRSNSLTISNDHYISSGKNFKRTGLGDKFIFLIACNFFYLNFDLNQSVRNSQKLLSDIIFQ